MILFVRMLSASALATAAFAAPSETAQPSTFVLSGEILVYSPSDSGLPLSAMVAPLGGRTHEAQLLTISGISTRSADGSTLVSSSLVHGKSPLVIGNQADNPIEIGDLSLQRGPDGWVLYSDESENRGRPVYRLADETNSVKAREDGSFVLTGELMLHETMAHEIFGPTPPASLIAGSFAFLAAPAQGGISSARTGPALPVAPQPLPPPPGAGPDVIVSSIGGNSLLKHGTVGTITSYSVQTVSCNIGTLEAEWFQFQPRHPVIGTQLYRLKTVAGATRFEQLGMSWLKHGFCAADASNCGQTPTPNGSCDWLGLWSTDTYTASRNGTQSTLGPRSEIQPWTGSYPYPFILGAGGGGGTLHKRCQIENADLDPAQNAGASYLTEVVYICTDEPDYHKHNGYSNRATTVGSLQSGGYNLSLTGSTNREQAAIQRWPLLDSGVTLVNVDVPGDGRIIVGAKATDLGGGLYNYEYAVFNQTCHDSVRLVSVPADATVTVSNVGFHDVHYHSGEPYSGTDWTGSRTLTGQEWSTNTFATNANANAIRWSTTYNFRFVADAPPVTGNVGLGLFRSGGNATAAGLPVPGSGLPVDVSYCFGDGLQTACPCGNSSAPAGTAGCANSLLIGGTIASAGTASISADTLTLAGGGMPSGPCLYFQGTAQNGSGTAFGDGLMCAGGALTRLGVEFNVAGASVHPSGDPAISVQGAVTPGVRTYQIWYRDSDATFCTASTFNLTNGRQVVWMP